MVEGSPVLNIGYESVLRVRLVPDPRERYRYRLHTGYAGVGSLQCNDLISVLLWTELHYAPDHGKYNIFPCSVK